MIRNAKNGSVPIGSTEMSYVSFGSGSRVVILLPGLSDGLTTVKGKALLLAAPYRLFFKDFTVYMFSRKNELPDGYSIREMTDDQAEAMRKLGIKKAAVMGVSEGGTDQIVGCAASYQMQERIHGSELYIYEKYGHAAYEEAADFNKRVYDFLVR